MLYGLDAINMDGAYTSFSGNSLRLDNYEVNTRYAFDACNEYRGLNAFTTALQHSVRRRRAAEYHQFSLLADYDLISEPTCIEGGFNTLSRGDGTVLLATSYYGPEPVDD